MKSSMEQNIRIGRPFGGTGSLWNKKFSKFITPRVDYKHERVSVIEIKNAFHKILCINAYFPFLDTSKLDSQKAIFSDTIGYIDYIMDNNLDCSFILAGDINCNIYKQNHPFTPLIRDLMQRRSLCCTYDLIENFDPNTAWTRSNFGSASTGTLIDYIFVSEDIKALVSNVKINHLHGNLSDHLPVSIDIQFVFEPFTFMNRTNFIDNVNWSNLDESIISRYNDEMENALRSINVPFHSLLHGNCLCENTDHVFCIEKYFCDIVGAIEIADKYLPRSKPGISKDYWTTELSELKAASFDAHKIWLETGKPSSGPLFNLKKSTHFRYKHAIKVAKNTFEQEQCDRIHDQLTEGTTYHFWKSWKSVHGKGDNDTTRINGKFENGDIANEFANSFRRIYDEANTEQARVLSNKFHDLYNDYFSLHKNDDLSSAYLSWDNMVDIMSKLEAGKASGSKIKAEHILHGSPLLVIHLQLLFNSMVQHSYVPSAFLKGVITPIVKDPEGDLSTPENYRGITLSHVFSYLFDHAVLLKIDSLLDTENLQFGYKKKHSTSHAIFTVKKCINYFRDHGSYVYASFLDCTKGFDRVSHDGLFTKLLRKGLPLCWLKVLMYWYSNMHSVCRWKDAVSAEFPVISGVRQGGVLSAKFWALYMNDLFRLLKAAKVGCHIGDIFVGCVLYADDVCLLAPTRKAMQRLLDICSNYAQSWCIKYNEKKTKMMFVGNEFNSFSCEPLFLNGKSLEFVSSWKYLGVTVTSEKNFCCSVIKPRSAFYRSSNSILNILNTPSEQVQMKLLYTMCVPHLTNACDVVDFHSKDLQSLHVALNDAIRKIFGYDRWQSIKELRESFGYPSVTEIFARRKATFEKRIPHVGNALLSFLMTI